MMVNTRYYCGVAALFIMLMSDPGLLAQNRVPPLSKLVRQLDSIAAVINCSDLKVHRLSFANVDDLGTIINDFGSQIYIDELQNLKPRLLYDKENNGTVQMKLRLIHDNGDYIEADYAGDLKAGQQNTIVLDVLGIASSDYIDGRYQCQLWEDSKLLYNGTLNIAPDEPKIQDCKLFKVNDIGFVNQTKNGTLLSEKGEKICAEDARYIASVLSCTDLQVTESLKQTVFSIRIYRPNRILLKCDDAPTVGYTISRNAMHISSNEIMLVGIGKDNKGIWKPGEYKYEVWVDDCKIIDTVIILY